VDSVTRERRRRTVKSATIDDHPPLALMRTVPVSRTTPSPTNTCYPERGSLGRRPTSLTVREKRVVSRVSIALSDEQ
jgi:hypothetical protein